MCFLILRVAFSKKSLIALAWETALKANIAPTNKTNLKVELKTFILYLKTAILINKLIIFVTILIESTDKKI